MSDLFQRLFAGADSRQAAVNQTPNIPQSRRQSNPTYEKVFFRIVNIFEISLILAVYQAIFWMALFAFFLIAVSVLLTSPVWLPCSVLCLPPIVVIVLLCKFTTIPSRSANSVKESNIVKKFSWNSIFGIAKT